MADNITLVGLSGSGKSTIAEPLAKRLRRPIVDVDELVEETAGADVSKIIHERGEAVFRQLEVEAVQRACEVDGAIIATGGGAVIDPLNRWALWHSGPVAWLDAPDDVLLERLARHYKPRPLLEGNAAERLAALRRQRAAYYRAADVHVDAMLPVDQVVDTVISGAERGVGRSRRLYDAEMRQEHPMAPSKARVVLGEHLDATVFSDVLIPLSTGAPIVVADRGAAKELPELLGALPGEALGLPQAFVASCLVLLPVSLLHGALFPAACAMLPRADQGGALGIAKAYIWETVGTIVGGAGFTWLLVTQFHSFQVALGLSVLNTAVCPSRTVPTY